jgi:hypothetical protein
MVGASLSPSEIRDISTGHDRHPHKPSMVEKADKTSPYNISIAYTSESTLENILLDELWFELSTQAFQKTRMTTVDGMVTTKYTHILLVPPHPPSPNEKKVVLKNTSDFISGRSLIVLALLTETKVAGRNIIVSNAIDFITELSCWTMMLYACVCQYNDQRT